MNSRVVIIGLLGGLLTGLTLNYPLHDYLPGTFVPGWPLASAGWAWALIVVAIVIVLGTGALGARTSGASEWRRGTMAGAIAGLLAALIAEVWVGGAAAGVWAARPLLASGLGPVTDNVAFTGLIAEATINVQTWSYLSAWIAVVGGLGLGAVGGRLAGVGGPRAEPMPKLYRTLAVVGVLVSAFTLVVASATSVSLRDSLQETARQTAAPSAYAVDSVTAWPVVTGFAALLLWQALGFWWLGSAQPETMRERRTVVSSIYLQALLPLAVAMLFGIAPALFANAVFIIGLTFSLGLGAMTLLLLRAVRSRETSAADEPEGWRYYVSVGALSAIILFATVYIVNLLGLLNTGRLVTPIAATALLPAAISDSSADLTPKGIVDTVYMIHLSLLAYFGLAAPFLTLMVAVFGWLVDRLATRVTPKA